MNIFDGAIIVAAIAGGVMGGIVAAIISLGVLRSQRRVGGTSIGAPHASTGWRAPSGPLARHLTRAEPAAVETETTESAKES